MIVRCETCHSEFSLDENGIGPAGATVRCSVCAYVFRVKPPEPWRFEQHPWQIRTTRGELFVARDFRVLRRWIAEGRVGADDQLSRTGKRWTRLGEMPEWSRYFDGSVVVAAEVERELSVYQLAQHPAQRPTLSHFRPPSDAPIADVSLVAGKLPSRPFADEVSPALSSPAQRSASGPAPTGQPAKREWGVGVDELALAQSVEENAARRVSAWPILLVAGLVGAGVWGGVYWMKASKPTTAPEAALTQTPATEVSSAQSERIAKVPAPEQKLDTAELRKRIASLSASQMSAAIDELRAALVIATAEERRDLQFELSQAAAIRAMAWGVAAAVDASQRPGLQVAVEKAHKEARVELENYRLLADGTEKFDALAARVAAAVGDRNAEELLRALPSSWGWPQAYRPVLALWRDLSMPTRAADVEELRAAAAQMRCDETFPLDAELVRSMRLALLPALPADAEAWLEAQPSDAPIAVYLRRQQSATQQAVVVGEQVQADAAPPTQVDTFDAIVERGCAQVERGDASGGISTLLRAFDERPDDLEVLLCMGQAHAKERQHARALALFERILGRSPSHRLALFGAATSAAAQGDDERATKLFTRLLKVDPSNAIAKGYLDTKKREATVKNGDELPSLDPQSER